MPAVFKKVWLAFLPSDRRTSHPVAAVVTPPAPFYYLGPGLHLAFAHLILIGLVSDLVKPATWGICRVFGAALLVNRKSGPAVGRDMRPLGFVIPAAPHFI